MTPMIDVVLQIIIFFMFTSRFGEMARSEIELPRQPGERAEAPDEPVLILDLTASGQLLIAGAPVSLDRAVATAKARAGASGSPSILVRCDRSADSAQLNRVCRALSGVGIERIALGTRDGVTP